MVDGVGGGVKLEKIGVDLSGAMLSSRSGIMVGYEEVSLVLDGGLLVFQGGS